MRNVNCEIFYGLSVLSVKTKKYILAKVQYSMWKYMGCLYCRWKLRLISWQQCFQQLFPWEHVCLLAFCNLHLYFYIILYLSTSWQYCLLVFLSTLHNFQLFIAHCWATAVCPNQWWQWGRGWWYIYNGEVSVCLSVCHEKWSLPLKVCDFLSENV